MSDKTDRTTTALFPYVCEKMCGRKILKKNSPLATCVASPSFFRRKNRPGKEKRDNNKNEISPIYFTFMWEYTRAYSQICPFSRGSRKYASHNLQRFFKTFSAKNWPSQRKIIGFHCENWRGNSEQVFFPTFAQEKVFFPLACNVSTVDCFLLFPPPFVKEISRVFKTFSWVFWGNGRSGALSRPLFLRALFLHWTWAFFTLYFRISWRKIYFMTGGWAQMSLFLCYLHIA